MKIYHKWYNADMEVPDTCPNCGAMIMLDWTHLEIRPVSKIYTVSGYTCQQCHRWKPCWYSNRLLDEAMRKLESMSPMNKSFMYHFAKVLQRADEIQKRGQETNGTIRHKDMASA